MSTGFVGLIKEAAMEAMHNTQMCDLRYGKVVSVSPLKIQVTDLFTLPSSLLVVPKHLTDYEIDCAISESQEPPSGESEKKKMKVYNALKVGDKVALLRKQGGQSYFILDKI